MIEHAEIQTDKTGTYLQVYVNGGSRSLLVEDVLEAAEELAALRARVDELEGALEFMIAYNSRNGGLDSDWQKYASRRWGNWSMKMIEDAENEARALLESK